MMCPSCNVDNDKVIDSRAADGGRVIRRRRMCLNCRKRFTTYERAEQTSRLAVVKSDGTRQPFDAEKILKGVSAACGKRPVPEDVKRRLVEEIEESLHRDFDREVASSEIGTRVMERLRDVDEVAYIRFASEYRQFKSVNDILDELKMLTNRPRDVKDQQRLFP
ncbi:MAG: transcriptional regulator NrdR [Phycisphaeraceae bacterium]|nr:transcriptional regulator NrdR [Phycisphaeraceae bacterium]MCW5754558.1 transcriptional regulator NrdR [Phycisphaeraceae bacterium]